MARQLRGGRLGRFQERRKTDWNVGPEANLTAISSTSVVGWSSFVLPQVPGLTLIRTRGEFTAYLTAATALNDGFECAVGIGLASTAAATVGITALPTPLAEEDWDGWIFHQFFDLHAPGPIVQAAAALSTDNSFMSSIRIPIDSKAMRKVPDNAFALYGAIEVIVAGTAVMAFQARTRMLFKLP